MIRSLEIHKACAVELLGTHDGKCVVHSDDVQMSCLVAWNIILVSKCFEQGEHEKRSDKVPSAITRSNEFRPEVQKPQIRKRTIK